MKLSRLPTRLPPLSVGILTGFLGACGPGSGASPGNADQTSTPPPVEAGLSESPQWVDVHLPDLTEGGYNLALYRRRMPFLMDMNGAVVHTWPRVRASARARLLPSGHLAVISDRGRLKEYDWEGRPTWSYMLPKSSHMLHHDFDPLRNGNYLLLAHWPSEGSDYLLEVDRSGDVVWRWNSHEAIGEDFERSERSERSERRNLTHMNSVQELPPNPWFDQGHEAFKPGNILVSARNLNAVYIVARPSGEVVWRYYDDLDWQHEARMVPMGVPSAGNILLFNNGYHAKKRGTTLLEVDPLERSVVWSYRAPGFFSSTGGSQQALPNGNLLVTSSRGGRAFELTREGEIVWQWAPPYMPMRMLRYPYDYCPQLAALGTPSERPARRRDPEQFLDLDLYSFGLTHEVRPAKAGDSSVALLRKSSDCQQLVLPDDADELVVGYGIDPRAQCELTKKSTVRFGVSLRPADAEASQALLERDVGLDDFDLGKGDSVALRRETFSLAQLGGQEVEICLTLASASGAPPSSCFVWEAPGVRRSSKAGTALFEEEKTAEVQEHERQQLEALGYVN